MAGLALASAQATSARPSFSSAAECAEVDGLEPILRRGAVLVFGEIHGNRESPAFVINVACEALALGLSVTVALELLDSERPGIQKYLSSSGSDADRAELTANGIWSTEYQDGRSSAAMADLLERLRGFRAADQRIEVELFDRSGWSSGQERDRLMAEALSVILATTTSDVVVVLTGNIHSRVATGTPWDETYLPMAHLLAVPGNRNLVSLDVAHAGGTTWMCTGSEPSSCGVRDVRARETQTGLSIELDDDPSTSGHHGRYHVGPLSASWPAAGRPEDSP